MLLPTIRRLPRPRHAAFALVGALAAGMPPSATAADLTIRNGVFWKDTSGTPIYSQGGGILKVGGTWYWYGAKYAESVSYAEAPSPRPNSGNPTFSAVTVYSSTDLVNWKFEGEVLKAGAAGKMFDKPGWVGRLGVAYHKRTGKYVLLTQYSSRENGAGVLFATSDTPTGPFVYERLQTHIDRVATPTSGDQTLFVDDDGQAYLVFSSGGDRRNLYVAPLRPSDFLAVDAATRVHAAPAGGREGNAMFKHKGLYYFCSSDLHGWNASRSFCMTSTGISGPYTPEKRIAGTEADFSHVSQNGFFVPVHGSEGTTVLYAGDRWSNYAANGIGYNIWAPLSFEGSTPVFNSLSEFSLDAARGTWAVGKGNNYVLNPGFEADRVTQTGVAGWRTSWTSLRGAAPIVNVLDGRNSRWALVLRHADPSMGSAIQDVTLPNGRYTLRAWVRSSGGQGVARLFASGHGSPEAAHGFSGALGEWTQVSLPGIEVRNGGVQVGVYTEGKDGQWLMLDDVSLVRE